MKFGIDMGHTLSGSGSGASGVVKETDKNRLVGKRLVEMLKQNKHEVINCTVDKSDNDLVARTNLANAQALDLFVSLHLNCYADTSANGVETFIYSGSYSGKENLRGIAKKVNDNLVKQIGWFNRGVKEADFHVLRETNCPAILVELGFCSNKRDMDLWDTEKIARAIYEGITGQSYTEVKPEPPKPVTPPITPSKEKINVIYQVYANKKWLPNVVNTQDYAGLFGVQAEGVYANLSKGSIKYRVHTKNGSWLPWVTNRSDYAGIFGRPIDGIQFGLVGLSNYKVKYRVYVSGRWLPWVYNYNSTSEGYAGIYGQNIEGLQVIVE